MTYKTPSISIVIASYNSEKFLDNCLTSILKSKGKYEIIIVDDASTDKSISIIQKYLFDKRVSLIKLNKSSGPCRARNTGVKISKGQILLFLDSDTHIHQNSLENLALFLNQNPDVGAGQIKILNAQHKQNFDCAGEKITSLGFLTERAKSSLDVGQFDQITDIFSGKAAGMFIRRNIFIKTGGFDEDYYIFWEEPDLFWRVWKLGFRVVFFPDATVWHAYSTINKPVSRQWLLKLTYFGCRNHLSTIIKNGVGWQRLFMTYSVGFSWLMLCLLFVLKHDFDRAKSVIQAFTWIVQNRSCLTTKRNNLKKRFKSKFNSDPNWLPKITVSNHWYWYIGKGWSYIFNRPF